MRSFYYVALVENYLQSMLQFLCNIAFTGLYERLQEMYVS